MEAVSNELSFFTLPNCFELFGFDLLVDEYWHLWLLEVRLCSSAHMPLQYSVCTVCHPPCTLCKALSL